MGLRPVCVKVVVGEPQKDTAGHGSDHAYPQKHRGGDGSSIVSIHSWRVNLLSSDLRLIGGVGGDRGAAGGEDDGECHCVGDCTQGHEKGTKPPRPPDVLGFVTLRPEEVEEEAGAEDCCNRNTAEDVVRCYTDEVVVMDPC